MEASKFHPALRMAATDYQDLIPKSDLNKLFLRAMSMQWMLHTNTKMVTTLYNLGLGRPFFQKLWDAAYIND